MKRKETTGPQPLTVPSPMRSLFILLLLLFSVEVALMFFLPYLLPVETGFLGKFADATLLTLFCAPFIYRYIFQPFDKAAKRHETVTETVEAVHEAILRTAMDGFWIVKEDGRFREVNDTFCKLTGYSHEELLSMTIFDVEAGLTVEERNRRRQTVRSSGRICFETRYRRKDGSFFDVEVSAGHLADGSFFAFLRDISLQKRMVADLARSEEKYRTLVDNVTVGVTMVSPGMKILSTNRQSRLWSPGIDESGEILCYKAFNDPPRDSICPDCPTAQTLADGEIHEAVVSSPWKESTRHFHIVSSPVRDCSGALIGAIESVNEVTALMRSEEKLREAISRLNATFEATADGILVVDLNGRIVSYNQRFVQMLQVPVTVQETMDFSLLLAFIASQLKGEGRLAPAGPDDTPDNDGHILLEFKDGRSIESFCHSQRVGDIVLGKVFSFRDVTEQRRMEAQLRHAQKMEAIGTLTGKVAHDFNNMLTAIIGYCHLSQMQIDRSDPLMQNIKQITTAAERAAGLTQSLLEYSRKTPSNPQPLDLNEVVGKVHGLLCRLIGEDVALMTRLVDQPLVVVADAGQIQQVLMNLATNARDAMSGRGRLTISTDTVTIGADFIASYGYGGPGQYALLAVSDTGSGMDEMTCDRIFEPFFTTKSVGSGTGLGLSIVYGIIKQHNGYITVESREGSGTTFRIYLPITRQRVEEKGEVQQSLAKGGEETILVAEDNSEVKALLVDVLQGCGYHVITALDGEDCVECVRNNADEIDLIIMDVIMPRKNGKQAFAEIEILKPGMKVLFISGYTSDVFSDAELADGSFDFLPKPLSPHRLLNKVREVLDRT